MKKLSLVLVISVFFSGFLFSQKQITADEVYNHIAFLASDSLQGRFPGTDASKVAANYILNDFKQNGLSPLCDNGFQYFNIKTGKKIENVSLKIGKYKSKYNKEYELLAFSPSGTFNGNAVFAGWGYNIETDKYSWNDYKNIDAKGKWVIVFRGKPSIKGYPSSFFDLGASYYEKVLEAEINGAIGVIFINSYSINADDELIKPCYGKDGLNARIPAFSVNRSVANRMLKKNKIKIKEIENKINTDLSPYSFDLKIAISAETNVEIKKVQTQNVVAYIEGSDDKLKNEYIIIGAHYDHLGFGGCGSGSRMPDTNAVHNGADDNASGVAGVLEIAEYLSANKDLLKRSIIFIAFGAEERGLLGSKYFVDNLPIPKDAVYAMLNFDMLGKYSGKLDIMGTGSAKEFADIIAKTNIDTDKIAVKLNPKAVAGSDHASFYNKDIPILFFFASSFVDYHTPFDDIEFIDPKAEAEVLKYISNLTVNISGFDTDLTFVKLDAGKSKGKSGGAKVKLGIVPSFEEYDGDGFIISGVTADSPAEKAGMKAQDVIIKINDQKISNIYDYMARMKKVNPGNLITVEIIRNEKTIKLNIQL